MAALGLGKTLFNSSVCYFEDLQNLEILLTERLSRKKASGAWPATALENLIQRYDLNISSLCENRDVEDPKMIESLLNSQFPFFEYLKKNQLHNFSRHFNNKINFITHHLCHANAAGYMSPFDKAIILVIDGAGSKMNLFSTNNPEHNMINQLAAPLDAAEERSVYLFDRGDLKVVQKEVQVFIKSFQHPTHYFSRGLGSFYEKISEYIFNSKRSAGKVMGLAALGSFAANPIEDLPVYLEALDWNKQYKGSLKKDWEQSPHFKNYCDLAASTQNYFENNYINYLSSLKKKFPDYDNLIITGGCALNCTSNMKLFKQKIFSQIYIPPFPGDESIGLGAAFYSYRSGGGQWTAKPHEEQHGYFGPRTSIPKSAEIVKVFGEFEITQPPSITDFSAELLAQGHVIGWFQGRSESGPRALGNRSILARPDKAELKDYLNTHIKFRESFRPYGCSVLHEKSHLYFDVPSGFENPYMSFACEVKKNSLERLKEVTHKDGTSRMQTVRKTQNKIFHELIEKFGNKTQLYCLLNTSLNVMGEPIVETLNDAKNFLNTVPVYGLAVDNFFIRKV